MRISMKKTAAMSAAALCFAFAGTASGAAGTDASSTETPAAAMAQLKLESAWDKTFKKSDKVEHSKVMFRTRYGFTLAADMYIPKNAGGEASRHCGLRAVRRRQGTVSRALRADPCRAGFHHHCV